MIEANEWKSIVRSAFRSRQEKISVLTQYRRRGVEPSAPLSSIPEKKGPNEHMQFVAALEICEDKKESIKTEGKTFEQLKSKGPYSIIYDEEYPFSALGVVYSSSSNTNNFATGCLIGSNLVLSCAHSLFDKNDSSKICQKIIFVPGPFQGRTSRGFKVKQTYIPKEYSEKLSTENSSGKQSFDYAILHLDTEINLQKYFGSIGYDFKREKTLEYQEQMASNKDIDIELAGYLLTSGSPTLRGYSGSAYCCGQFFLYIFNTERGISGSPLLSQNKYGYITNAIHLMNTKIDDEPLTIKAALRLSPKIFEDIKSNFKREGIKHIYDLEQKGIQDKDMPELLMEITAHQYQLRQQLPLLRVDLHGNTLGDLCCHYLSKTTWSHLEYLNLASNNVGDQGCLHLSKGRWPLLQKLGLGWNRIDVDGCKHLANAQHWNSLGYIWLWHNSVEKEDGQQYFEYLPWNIVW